MYSIFRAAENEDEQSSKNDGSFVTSSPRSERRKGQEAMGVNDNGSEQPSPPIAASQATTDLADTVNKTDNIIKNDNHPSQQQQPASLRPTEAQLRWAQFHHKRRATSVKTYVENCLWMTPANVSDVEGAQSDDGNTTVASTASSTASFQSTAKEGSPHRRKRQKPKISRGRRALLRVSKRSFETRRKRIQECGFRRRGDEDEYGGMSSSDDDGMFDKDDGLAVIFAEETFLRKQRRRRQAARRGRRRDASGDDERVRRFEAAFHSMMISVAAAQQKSQQDPTLLVAQPTRIWTRPEGLDDAGLAAVDFSDLRWGMAHSSLHNPSAATLQPLDRGASWLVHLPAKDRLHRRNPDKPHPAVYVGSPDAHPYSSDFSGEQDGPDDEYYCVPDDNGRMTWEASAVEDGTPHREHTPVKPTLTDIVDMLQRRVSIATEQQQQLDPSRGDFMYHAVTPRRRVLSKYFEPAQLGAEDREEKKDDASVLGRLDFPHTPTTSGNTFEEHIQELRSSATKKAPSPAVVNSMMDDLNSELIDHLEEAEPGISRKLFTLYMSESELLPEDEDVDAIRGRLIDAARQHLEVFAKSYLTDAQAEAFPRDSPSVYCSGLPEEQPEKGLVSRFVSQIEEAVEKEELIFADGKLHKPTFARLVREYLLKASDSTPKRFHRVPDAVQSETGNISGRVFDSDPEKEFSSPSRDDDSVSRRNMIVESLVSKLEAVEVQSFVDNDGIFDRNKFETMVSRYLAEASGASTDAVIAAKDVMSLVQSFGGSAGSDGYKDTTSFSAQEESFVQQFVAEMERMAAARSLIVVDGKLHKPEFAQLIKEYLSTTRDSLSVFSRRGLVDSCPGRLNLTSRFESSGHDKGSEPDFDTDVIAEDLLAELEKVSDEKSVIDETGRVNGSVFESLIRRYLSRANESYITDNSDTNYLPKSSATPQSTPVAANTVGTHPPKKTRTPIDKAFVAQFVNQIERASELEPVFTNDGKLVKPAFEKMLTRYVEQAAPKSERAFSADVRSPVMLARARQSARKPSRATLSLDNSGPSLFESPAAVRRFIDSVEAGTESEPVITAAGKLNKEAFESLVDRCLMESWAEEDTLAAQVDEVDQEASVPVELLEFVELFSDRLNRGLREDIFVEGDETINQRILHDLATSCINNSAEDEIDCESMVGELVFRSPYVDLVLAFLSNNSFPQDEESRVKSFLLDLALECLRETGIGDQTDISSSAQENSSLQETPVRGTRRHVSTDSKRLHDTKAAVPPEAVAQKSYGDKSLADSISDRVGDFARIFQSSSRDSQDELLAVAAFRKTQDERRGNDDNSSLSSFRVLPDGIKQVVKNFRKGASGSFEEPGNNSPAVTNDTQSSSVVRSDGSSQLNVLADAPSFVSSNGSYESDFSPERVRKFNHKMMENSTLFGDTDRSQSVIDTDGSDASGHAMDPALISNLLLSPTILTKRHQQAIRAVENRNWEQVEYLMSANPWLAEMTDLTTNQYLLHKLALFGTADEGKDAAPSHVNTDLIRMFPASVHKFDHSGNLPLHMAAAAANYEMISLLGDRFPSGASVRNEDGMLPLHLSILAVSSPAVLARAEDSEDSPTSIVRKILNYFPGAIAVPDNDGNLPIHTAVSSLNGVVGIQVVTLLLNEADKQLRDPMGVRFRHNSKPKDVDELAAGEENLDTVGDEEEDIFCNLVRNDLGETPLMMAIRYRVCWQIVEALVEGDGGADAVFCQDSAQNNALHLLVDDLHNEPASVMSVLKVAPSAARVRNESGMLPIEIACRQNALREVVMALVLVDLPFDVDDSSCSTLNVGHGQSWFFLTCECDDYYVDVVQQVVSLCSYQQVRELCFLENRFGETLLARASPKCRTILQKSLRFVGRFEFVETDSSDAGDPSSDGYRMFNAIDYAEPFPEGRRVVLKCFVEKTQFEEETHLLRELDPTVSFLAEANIFAVGEDGSVSSKGAQQYCVSIEQPNLTLAGVVTGMLSNEECQTNQEIRERYTLKVFAVLRVVAKAIRYLHSIGLVHGQVSLDTCGKYRNKWKIGDLMGIQRLGERFASSRFSRVIAPESLSTSTSDRLPLVSDLTADPAIDVWAFGQLAFEVLTGEPLVKVEAEHGGEWPDHELLSGLLHWGEEDLHRVCRRLSDAFVSETGASLIASCLSPHPNSRPTIEEVLKHHIWSEVRRQPAN